MFRPVATIIGVFLAEFTSPYSGEVICDDRSSRNVLLL